MFSFSILSVFFSFVIVVCPVIYDFGSTLLGERTFGVLTKLDLMDKGTNALDVRSFYFFCLIVLKCYILGHFSVKLCMLI